MLCIVAFCLPNKTVAGAEETSATPTLRQIRTQVSKSLRKDSLADDPAAKRESVKEIFGLYVSLLQDDRLTESFMLQRDVSKLRRRLLAVARRIESEQRRQKNPRPADLAAQLDRTLQSRVPSDADDTLSDNSAAVQDSKSAATELPTGLQAAGLFDNGWQLVELIERIVEPNFWQNNGGNGAIVYFPQQRVLVVRATSDIHEQVRDLLLALPR